MGGSPYEALDDLLHKCIHCGMCLPVCPTYNITYQEQSSPRGRIRLMKSVHDGSLDLSSEFVHEMYFCLDCQACQTACPAGVEYGKLVEDARHLIGQHHKEPFLLHLIKSIVLRILSSKSMTKTAARCVRWYRKSGIFEAVERSAILSLVSDRLHAKHAMLPAISGEFFDESTPEVLLPAGKPRGRVAFLSGCVMNVVFSEIHRHAVGVLLANNFEVIIPKQQVCCGSLHNHNGEQEAAKDLARQNIDAFDSLQVDALVVDSAGCSAFLKEYGHLFADDVVYAAKAKRISESVKDITEFLSETGFTIPTAPLNKRITYHEACHLVHTQKISRQPRKLLQSIPGVEFLELPEATWCCGSAGIYNVTNFDDSMGMLERKMNNLISTNADIVVTANPGCHLQLQYGIKRRGLNAVVMHPVSLLFQAYRESNMV